MINCAHSLITTNLKERIRHIKRQLVRNARRNIGPKCDECSETQNLCIEIDTGIMYCPSHVYSLLETTRRERRQPPKLYMLDRDEVHCPQCNCFVPLKSTDKRDEVTQPPKNNLFTFYALKKMPDIGETTGVSSLLQTILNVPMVRDHFLSFHHPLTTCDIGNCRDCFFKRLISQVYSPDPVDLSESVNYILKLSNEYTSFDLTSLVDVFHLISNIYHTKQTDLGECQCIMHRTFFGLLQQSNKCATCNSMAFVTEHFSFLKFPIYKDMDLALKDFFALHLINENYYCRLCAGRVSSYTQKLLRMYPPFLVIHFNRARSTNSHRRVATKISIPRDIQAGECRYSLYASIVQKKTTPCSYVAYILLGGEWYEFSSERVQREADAEQHIQNIQNSSMLFYEKAQEQGGEQSYTQNYT